jgi:hypothetical protein
MAIAAFLVVFLGALALFRLRDWRFATWMAGVMAVFLGLVSVVFPGNPSSLGVIRGVLLVVWALAFVASVERARSDGVERGTESENEAVTGSSLEQSG